MGYNLGPNKFIEIDEHTMGVEAFSKGERFVCLFDREDYNRIKMFRWVLTTTSKKNRSRYLRTQPYVTGPSKNWTMSLHQLIMSFPEKGQVDHINQNGLDNRKANLRVVSQLENARNKTYSIKAKSGYFGVSFREQKCGKNWRAVINHFKYPTFLGSFETKEEAARAYDAKAIELRGEFAILNFPEEHKLLA